MLAQPPNDRALKSPAPRALPQECAGELTPGEALGLPDAWVRRNVRLAVALLILCSAIATPAVTTVTGNLLDLTGQNGLTTKISFIPDSTILINNNGLAAGPSKTITATNGFFSIVLDPQNYTVALPLISGRDPFSIAVGYNLGVVNITNCMVPNTYFTKQLITNITGLSSNQLTTINPSQIWPVISFGGAVTNGQQNVNLNYRNSVVGTFVANAIDGFAAYELAYGNTNSLRWRATNEVSLITYRTGPTPINDLTVVYANYNGLVGQQAGPANNNWQSYSTNMSPVTIQSLVEYPNGVFHFFTFGGQTNVICQTNAMVQADRMQLFIPANTKFRMRQWASVPSAPMGYIVSSAAQNGNVDLFGGTAMESGSLLGTNDIGFAALTNTIPVADGVTSLYYNFAPCAILSSGIGHAIAFIGDSVSVSSSSQANASGTYQGYFAKAVGTNYPSVAMNWFGNAITYEQTNANVHKDLTLKSCDIVLDELGFNDLALDSTFSRMTNLMTQLWVSYATNGVSVYQTTITPRVSLVNLVPAGATYTGGGTYTLSVTNGWTYLWTTNNGGNDTLVNYGAGDCATNNWLFTATSGSITLKGIPSAAVTAKVDDRYQSAFHETDTMGAPRAAINTWLRTCPPPLSGIFDVAAQVEVGTNNVLTTNGGVWLVNGLAFPNGICADGVHPQTNGALLLAAALTNWVAQLTPANVAAGGGGTTYITNNITNTVISTITNTARFGFDYFTLNPTPTQLGSSGTSDNTKAFFVNYIALLGTATNTSGGAGNSSLFSIPTSMFWGKTNIYTRVTFLSTNTEVLAWNAHYYGCTTPYQGGGNFLDLAWPVPLPGVYPMISTVASPTSPVVYQVTITNTYSSGFNPTNVMLNQFYLQMVTNKATIWVYSIDVRTD